MDYTRHLFNPHGYWVAFLVGRELFRRNGERLGWVEPPPTSDDRPEQHWRGGVVKAENGDLIGIITAQNVIQLQETAVPRLIHS
jgi:hypothetical protein